MDSLVSRFRHLWLVLVLVLFGGAIYLSVNNPDPATDEVPRSTTTSVPVPGTTPITVDRDSTSDNEPNGPGIGAHEDLKEEFPEGVKQEQLERGVQQKAPTKEPLLAPQPVGGAQNYSCSYKPVVNQSSSNGQKKMLFVLHFTVSKPGSMNTIWGLFNRRSFAASSTFLMEQTGRCLRLMGLDAKPWTQGNFNGRSISVEIIATGNESKADWLNMPMIKNGTLASLARDVMRQKGIPLRLVDPSGCTVQKAGWTDHDRLECGNSHWDVGKNFPFAEFQRQLTAGTSSTTKYQSRKSTLTKTERAKVDDLQARRRIQKRRGGWSKISPQHLQSAVASKKYLTARMATLKKIGLTSKNNRAERYRVMRAAVS